MAELHGLQMGGDPNHIKKNPGMILQVDEAKQRKDTQNSVDYLLNA